MNKLDKVKSSERLKQRKKIEEIFSGFKVIAFSSQSLVGREELIGEILKI